MVVVAVGGISHETNTFSTRAMGLTTLEDFKTSTRGVRTGEEVVKLTGQGGGYLGGLNDAARELGYELKGQCVGGWLARVQPP